LKKQIAIQKESLMEKNNCLIRLEEAERNYRELVENVNSVILRMDNLGNVLFMNPFGLEFFGFSQEELLGQNVVGTIVPEVESSGRDLRQMIDDMPIHPEKYTNNLNENVRKNEERIWIAWTNKPMLGADKKVLEILCIGNDVTERKKMEEELQVLASVVKKSHEIVNLATLDGKMMFLNEAGREILGISEKDVKSTHILDVIPDHLKEKVQNEVLPSLMKNGGWQGELECQNIKNGAITKVHATIFLILDQTSGKPKYLANVSRSIGKRKMAEEALRLNEERLRLAMEATQQGWFDLNIQTGEVVVSPEYPKILGFEPGELDASLQSWINGIHPEDRDAVLATFDGCLKSTNARMMEYRRKTKNGEWKWILSIAQIVEFDSAGNPLRMIGTHTDISQRKYAEEALRQSEEKFQKAFMLNPAPTMISCLESGIFVDINESFLRASGYDRKEVIGKTTVEMDFVPPEARNTLMNALEKDGKVMDVGIKVKIKSGEFRDARLSSEVVKIDEADCVLTVLEDVTERKRAEEALAESRNYLAKIINTVADPIFVKDDQHRWVLVNNAFCLFMGYAEDDLLGKSDYDFLPREQAEVFWSKDAFVLETGEENINEELLTDSGGVVHTIVTKKTLYTDEKGERFIVGIIRDISEQKKVENALQENYHFLQTLIDAIPNPIFFKDTGLRYVGCNTAYEEAIGIKRDNFIGAVPSEVFSENLAKIYTQMDQALFESQTEQIYESVIEFADGKEHNIIFCKAPYKNRQGNLAGLVGVIVDITERKQSEDRLRQAKLELEQTFDFLPDATLVIDIEGKVIAWNKAIEEMTGIPKEKMLGKGNYEYAIPFYGERRPILIDLVLKKSEKHEGMYEAIYREGEDILAETFAPKAFQGKGVYIAGKASPLYDSNQKLVGAIESIRDITDRKGTEESMREQERIRALGEMASGIAHDMNNLLVPLFGIPEMMKMMLLGEDINLVKARLQNFVERMLTEAKSLQQTVARLQDFYRPVSEVDSLDVNTIISASVETLKPKWSMLNKDGRNINIDLDLQDNLAKVMGSGNEIKQMLINLILNSIYAIPDKGKVTVRSFADEDKVVIEVADTGSGMSEEVKEKCLKPFFTTKGKNGTGIGLHSVFMSMNRHKGSVSIKSQLGEGTAVSLAFPASDKKARVADEIQKKTVPPLNILLIDDDKDVRDMMAMLLESDGHQVIKAHSGREGLALFEPETCKLVITDLGMPEISGYEVVKKIREISQDIPIIVSTGFGDYLTSAETSRLLSFGCVILRKPAKIAEIQDTIAKILKL
jgi:PAS domain S-box-containing protein